MTPPIDDQLDAQRRQIQPCEPRLALSGSVAAQWLLDVLGPQFPADPQLADPQLAIQTHSSTPDPTAAPGLAAPSPQDPLVDSSHANQAPDLIAQAADLRTSRGLSGSGQSVAIMDSGSAWDRIALGGGFGPGYR